MVPLLPLGVAAWPPPPLGGASFPVPCWVGSRVGWGWLVRVFGGCVGCWVVGWLARVMGWVLGYWGVGSGVGLGDWLLWVLGCWVASRLGV